LYLANELLRTDNQLRRAEQKLKLGEKSPTEKTAPHVTARRVSGKGPQADRLKTKPRDFTRRHLQISFDPVRIAAAGQRLSANYYQGRERNGHVGPTPAIKRGKRSRCAISQNHSFSGFQNEKALPAIVIPPKPPVTSSLISSGKSEYQEAGCAQCHGVAGKGDGPSAKDLKDDWGSPITPADLTLKPFKSGPDPQDLYRMISTGLNGTPIAFLRLGAFRQ